MACHVDDLATVALADHLPGGGLHGEQGACNIHRIKPVIALSCDIDGFCRIKQGRVIDKDVPDSKMFLFSNKSTLEENQISQELLFQDLSQLNFILSEFPKAEYFLKIEQGEFDITWLIDNLKMCSGILSCYKVEIKNEKSKYNLIFE